jgi:hypothetical protein
MNKIFIVDQHKNPGLLRFTQTKLFFDAKNQGTDWASDCVVVDSIDDISDSKGIVINSGEFVTSTFRHQHPTTSTLLDARGHGDLIQFTPDYTYEVHKRPPYPAGSKHLYILENLYKVVLKSNKLVYLDNTELILSTTTHAQHFYGLASGWKSVQLIKNFGIESFESITIYDNCQRQLEYQEFLHGCATLPDTIDVPPPVYGEYNPPQDVIDFWPMWHNTKVKFELIDLFADTKFLDNSFVWISNAFMYEPSIFRVGWEKCKLAKHNLITSNKTCTITEV